MANKKTVALTEEQFVQIIKTIKEGIKVGTKIVKPNIRIATILVIQGNLGLRIGDVLSLCMNDFLKDGERYRINIIEEKTNKKREFTVTNNIYNYIRDYAYTNQIKPTAKLFDITERAVQKHLQIISEYLNIENISTHSFRKFFATQIYVNNNYNIELVRLLLQHSSVSISQKYIGIQPQEIEQALKNHIKLL